MKKKLKKPVHPYDRLDFCQLSYKELQELKKQYYKDAKEYYDECFEKKQVAPDEDNQLSVPASLCLGALLIIGCFFSIIGLLGILFLIIMDLPDIYPEGWLLILEFIGFFLLYLGIKK